MRRELLWRSTARWLLLPWLGALVCLALATAASLVLAQILLSPTGRDLRALAVYLALSGAASMTVGWLGLQLADRIALLRIQTKVFFACLIGTGVGPVNVFVVAKLMFLSSAHDLRLLIALLAFSAVLTLFFTLWVAVRTTARIATAMDGIRALAAGDYRATVAIEGRDEAAELGGTVNELGRRLREVEEERGTLERERRELTAAASHDLRTPLASLCAMVDALEDGIVEDPVEVHRYHATMRRELDHLSRMVEELFELAQVDTGAARLERRPAALQDIAAEVADAMRAEAARSGIGLTLHVEGEPPAVFVDGSRIERALGNLVRNALQHTPAGGDVAIEVCSEPGWVRASVSDTGEGIDPVHIGRIWERFYRVDPSRTHHGAGTTGGAGLGLAIVRGIVEAHGGVVGVQSAVGRGSEFTVRLPVLVGRPLSSG